MEDRTKHFKEKTLKWFTTVEQIPLKVKLPELEDWQLTGGWCPAKPLTGGETAWQFYFWLLIPQHQKLKPDIVYYPGLYKGTPGGCRRNSHEIFQYTTVQPQQLPNQFLSTNVSSKKSAILLLNIFLLSLFKYWPFQS